MSDYPEEIDVKQFVNLYFDEQLPRRLKSQKEAPEPVSEYITELTNANFEEVVQESKKDVLVLFYASWCQHCKALMPDFVKLSRKAKNNKNII